MKLYLESLRKLARVGLTLLALSVIATLVLALRYCTARHSFMPSVVDMFPALIAYTFVGGVGLALYGFSFLTKRTDSDFYHSLPVKRAALYRAIVLAALTWVAATVLLSLIAGTTVFLSARMAFVPAYPLLALPFFIVSTMLVFAAAAIACCITGTLLSNAALTAVVLFLPRFLQFVIARGVVAGAQIISWLDMPWYLDPCTNIATGQIVMLTRRMLIPHVFDWGNIVYSLFLTLAELVIAQMLFARRDSELAGQGAKNRKLQTLFACLLVTPVVTLFASRALIPNTQNLLIVGAASLACFAVYQIVTLRSGNAVLRSLPWFLAPAALAIGLFFTVWGAAEQTLRYVPQHEQVAYVTFPAQDRSNLVRSYGGMQAEKVCFEDDATKRYVLGALQENVDSHLKYGYYYHDYERMYNQYSYELPVTLVLNSGRKVGRVITFYDVVGLNELREQNASYRKAIRTLAPSESICYRQDVDQNDETYHQSGKLTSTFYAEVEQTGVVPYHFARNWTKLDGKNETQSFGALTISGYVGMQRYRDSFHIMLELPKTCSAWMEEHNSRSTDVSYAVLQKIVEASESFLDNGDNFNCQFSFYNAPAKDGGKQMRSMFGHMYARSENGMKESLKPLLKETIEILCRSEMTHDPNRFCVYTQWSGRARSADGTYIGYDGTGRAADGNTTAGNMFISSDGGISHYGEKGMVYAFNPSYRAFSPADEKRMIEILREWDRIEQSWTYIDEDGVEKEIYMGDDEAATDKDGETVVAVTPTPVPQPAG